MTTHPTTPSAVRTRVLADHASLRHRLAELADETAAARCGEPHAELRMNQEVAKLCDALLAHLAYEEAKLAPLLRAASAWGVVVVAHLLDEHRAQRATIWALREDANSGKTTNEIADEIDWFIRGIRRDMDEEETTLLTSEALGEEHIVADQTSG